MEDMDTPPNCARPSGHGWKATVTRRPAPQAVWCRRPSRNGLASRSVSAISTRSVPVSAWEAALLPRGKKLDAASSSPAEPQWQEGAGGAASGRGCSRDRPALRHGDRRCWVYSLCRFASGTSFSVVSSYAGANAALSRGGRTGSHLGSAQLHRRCAGRAHGQTSGLWIFPHRTLPLTDRSSERTGHLHGWARTADSVPVEPTSRFHTRGGASLLHRWAPQARLR